MKVDQLSLTNYRCYGELEARFGSGRTLVLGPNGSGKTSTLEAIAYLGSLESFRGGATETVVRDGADRAVVRGVFERAGHEIVIDVELGRRRRVRLNGNRVTRVKQIRERCAVTVFTPDDLAIVKGGPEERRRFLDTVVLSVRPPADSVRVELDRVLRQRNSLLRQARGHLDVEARRTLDVWDTKLAVAGDTLAQQRLDTLEELSPSMTSIYGELAGGSAEVGLTYRAPWLELGLANALADTREDDVRRGVTTTGPHRDDVEVTLDGMPARTQASQGEQRCLALALRLASHQVVGDAIGTDPVLLLDDVFSELDDDRAAALVGALPPGQAILTSTVGPPDGWGPELVLRADGTTLVAT